MKVAFNASVTTLSYEERERVNTSERRKKKKASYLADKVERAIGFELLKFLAFATQSGEVRWDCVLGPVCLSVSVCVLSTEQRPPSNTNRKHQAWQLPGLTSWTTPQLCR